MKIRAITFGQNIPYLADMDKFENEIQDNLTKVSQCASILEELFENLNIEVQTSRICSQPIFSKDNVREFESNFESTTSLLEEQVFSIQNLIKDFNIDYFSSCSMIADSLVNNSEDTENRFLNFMSNLLKKTQTFFSSVQVASVNHGINLSALKGTTEIIKTLSDPVPMDNLRFCVSFNLFPKTTTPFFPASLHQGKDLEYSLALEMADEVVKISENASDIQDFQFKLRNRFEAIYELFENSLNNIDNSSNFKFSGIDFSPAPFPTPEKSIGKALENLGIGHFGSLGSLLGVGSITSSIPKDNDRIIGFSGFMQPVLEDFIISERLVENKVNIESLLLYSTICGTGLDCVPLPGDITSEELYSILLDLCTISLKLDKPLTARLMPIPGKNVGDLVEFDFEYFAKRTRIINFDRNKENSLNQYSQFRKNKFKFID